MGETTRVIIDNIQFYMRNQTMRLPFRYGRACLTASPILHVRLEARGADGQHAIGTSADILPPKWFDKSPEKDYRRNIEDLLRAAQLGAHWFRQCSGELRPVFELWREAYAQIVRHAGKEDLNGLTGSFGASIIERAVIDAACRLAGVPYHCMLRENRFGIEPGAIHVPLDGMTPADILPQAPLDRIAIRHTVGLGDPIRDEDVSKEDRLDDGLPVSLEAWLREASFHYFKLKITGKVAHDVERLDRIAALLEEAAPGDYRVSLDGNEQFHSGDELKAWFAEVQGHARLRDLLGRTLFVEQPIERAAALDPAIGAAFQGLEDLPPIIIDESDDTLDAFARSARLGYRGTSVKNCKGVFKGVLNAMLVRHYQKERGVDYVLSAEDLANQPIVPLHQDLCAVTTLGIPHAERNGHHYGGTLAHLGPNERASVLSNYDDLYAPHDSVGRWRIRDGELRVGSLHRAGFGLQAPLDFDVLIPLADWDYAMLGLGD